MSLFLLILTVSLSFITSFAQLNQTNETTTFSPTESDASTTQLYTSTEEPTRTLSPTVEPTPSPIKKVTNSPTNAPNILPEDNDEDEAYLQEAIVRCITAIRGAITCDKVKNKRKSYFRALGRTSICEGDGENNDDSDACIVDIGDCKDIIYDPEETRRRLLETTSDIAGAEITYKIVLKDASLVTVHQQRINNGDILSEFSEALNDEYDDVDVDITFEEPTIGDPDEFLGNEDPTFGEIIASPYILLGIVCTIVGIIWLLFLRSNIENKYPSYLSQPASAPSMSGNAVEMVPQSSTAE